MENNNLIHASDREIFIFDVGLHILILYIVLLSMFFLIISPTSKRGINKSLETNIELLNYTYRDDKGDVLSPFDRLNIESGPIPGGTCDINNLRTCNFYNIISQPNSRTVLKRLQDYYQNNTQDLQRDSYNSALTISAIIILIVLFLFVGMSYYSLRYTARRKIDIKKLIYSNFLLFLMVGCIEVLFFYNITLNYSPTLPSELINDIIKNLKEKL